MNGQPPAFHLQIAVTPESVATARLFVGAVGQVVGWSIDQIDDAKLAVSEAVTSAIAANRADSVTVSVDPDGTLLTVAPLEEADLEGSDGISPISVVSALFADTRLDKPTGRLVVPVGDRGTEPVDLG